MFSRRLAHLVEVSGLRLNRLRRVLRENRFLQRGVESGSVRKLQPKRIAGNQRLPERDEIASLAGGLLDIRIHLREGGRPIQPDGGDLRETQREKVRILGLPLALWNAPSYNFLVSPTPGCRCTRTGCRQNPVPAENSPSPCRSRQAVDSSCSASLWQREVNHFCFAARQPVLRRPDDLPNRHFATNRGALIGPRAGSVNPRVPASRQSELADLCEFRLTSQRGAHSSRASNVAFRLANANRT